MRKVAVIDYGLGNLASVEHALVRCGAAVHRMENGDEFSQLNPKDDRVVLPGVGAFGDGMLALRERNYIEPLKRFVAEGGMLLGICLGMQMLFEVSAEFGEHSGLGLLPGRVDRIPTSDVLVHDAPVLDVQAPRRKIPHIGWAAIAPVAGSNWGNSILANIGSSPYLYFVHSYAANGTRPGDLLAVADYQGFPVTAAVQHGNVIGVQFHPEKSGETGLSILREFVRG